MNFKGHFNLNSFKSATFLLKLIVSIPNKLETNSKSKTKNNGKALINYLNINQFLTPFWGDNMKTEFF